MKLLLILGISACFVFGSGKCPGEEKVKDASFGCAEKIPTGAIGFDEITGGVLPTG
jgi:hypothetical protein